MVTAGDVVVGCAPLYLKAHSYGEYIFDWAWAGGAQRAGLRYYPKLVAAVPFTPATGPRLLVREDVDREEVGGLLARGALALADRIGASSVHWLFVEEAERELLGRHGYTGRMTHQYHWENAGYACFDDYLGHLGRRRRKDVRRERRRAAESGLTIDVVAGTDLRDADVAALYAFYRDTAAKKGAMPYLTEAFFTDLPRRRVVAVLARRDGVAVAGTLNFQRGDTLYGRYWGCVEDYDSLHFECCYYRLIEHAIERRLARFEAGAQGYHKVARGFLPVPTWSAHHVRHPGLAQAVDAFVTDEWSQTEAEIAWLRAHKSPFTPR